MGRMRGAPLAGHPQEALTDKLVLGREDPLADFYDNPSEHREGRGLGATDKAKARAEVIRIMNTHDLVGSAPKEIKKAVDGIGKALEDQGWTEAEIDNVLRYYDPTFTGLVPITPTLAEVKTDISDDRILRRDLADPNTREFATRTLLEIESVGEDWIRLAQLPDGYLSAWDTSMVLLAQAVLEYGPEVLPDRNASAH